jgi:phenylacetate-coenzyme A ligase PaaK-like adenylate-forming protein
MLTALDAPRRERLRAACLLQEEFMSLAPGFAPWVEMGHLGYAALEVGLGNWAQPAVRQRLVQRRLQSLVKHARENSPFYAQLYRDLPAGVPALSDLPTVNKPALMADVIATLTDRSITREVLDAFVADTSSIGHLLNGQYAVWRTSGTSGQPGMFLHDIGALAVYEALETLRFRRLSFAEYGVRLLAGERFALVSVTGGHFASVSTVEHLRHTFPWLAPNVAPFSLFTPLPELVEQLNAYKPKLLATYPTSADMLAGEQEAGRLKLRLSELWTGGESLAPCVKDRLEHAFGCRVRNEYGASECLSIAWECPHGVLHAHADFVLLEPVDANFQPVPPGTPSHSVLLTNLANRVQPIIRYDLGDSITLLPPCRCGSSMPAIRVEGRRDDTLCFAGAHRKAVELLPLVLTTVMEDEAGVFDFQLRQTDERTLRVVLGEQATEARPHVRKVLRAFLARCALAHVAVEFDSAPPLRNSTSGKLRRVVRVQTGARPA